MPHLVTQLLWAREDASKKRSRQEQHAAHLNQGPLRIPAAKDEGGHACQEGLGSATESKRRKSVRVPGHPLGPAEKGKRLTHADAWLPGSTTWGTCH